jgi:hypothetical protein
MIKVACTGGDHLVTVSQDRAGRARVEFDQHDRRAEQILLALGGPRPACLQVPGQMAALRPVERSPIERARWVAAGVTTPGELARWRDIADPDTAGRWRALGVQHAAEAAGWVEGEVDIECAERWVVAGLSLEDLAGWNTLGVWRPEQLPPWLASGVRDGRDARYWAMTASEPQDVRVWMDAGAIDGPDVIDWLGAGAHAPSALEAWRRAGVRSGGAACRWVKAGAKNGAEVAAWRAAGVETAASRAMWGSAGVAVPYQLIPWRSLRINSGSAAAEWVRPRLITGLDELAAWHAAGVTEPCRARELDRAQQTPAGVVEVRARRRRQSQDCDGRPALTVRYAGRREVTEVYFYSYGWRSARAEATHWVASELIGGEEVPRSRRHGLVVPGTEPWRLDAGESGTWTRNGLDVGA